MGADLCWQRNHVSSKQKQGEGCSTEHTCSFVPVLEPVPRKKMNKHKNLTTKQTNKKQPEDL